MANFAVPCDNREPMWRVPLALLAMLPIALLACSTAPLQPAGTLCNSDSDCGAGLSCLGFGAFTDAGR